MADIEAIIREARAREREDALTDDHPFMKRVMDQIDQKGYLIPYTADHRRLHKVGLSFSTKQRTLSEWVIN